MLDGYLSRLDFVSNVEVPYLNVLRMFGTLGFSIGFHVDSTAVILVEDVVINVHSLCQSE